MVCEFAFNHVFLLYLFQFLTGSPSDNEFIGIYPDSKLANDAKMKYIYEQIGTKEQYMEANEADEAEYQYDFDRLIGCVGVEEVKNRY